MVKIKLLLLSLLFLAGCSAQLGDATVGASPVFTIKQGGTGSSTQYWPSYTYASSTFPSFGYASSTYYFASNPSGYITSSALNPYLTTSSAATTYPTFTYASSSYYLASNPSNYITLASVGSGTVQSTGTLNEIFTRTKEPTGFENTTDSVISFATSTRTFIITGNYNVYYRGNKIPKTTGSIQIGTVWGDTYVYISSAGVLSTTTTAWDIAAADAIPVATIYWNASSSSASLQDERHGITMDALTHAYLHLTVGTRYQSGFSLTVDNNRATTSSGVIWDEDLKFLIPQQTTYQVWNRRTDNNWDFTTASTTFYRTSAGTILYDNAGASTTVGLTNYVAYWFFASDATGTPVQVVMGQRTDTTLANAQANNTYSSLVLTGSPFTEAKVIWRVIMRNVGGTPTYIESQDQRAVATLAGGGTAVQDHGTLTGLADDDHTQYLLVDGTRAAASSTVTGSTSLSSVLYTYPTGFVGVGTPAPTSKLQVNAGELSLIGQTALSVNQDGMMIYGGTNGGTVYARGNVSGGDDNLMLKWGDKLQFQPNYGSLEAMTILKTGEVGIGSTTPSSVLDIRGTTTKTTLNIARSDGYPVLNIDTAGSFLIATATRSNGLTVATNTTIGLWGVETTGVTLNSVAQTAPLYVTEVTGANNNNFILHRHSTNTPVLILGAFANATASNHVNPSANQTIMSVKASGWASTTYQPFAQIDFLNDPNGTTSATSSPGYISFKTSANGTTTPAERMFISHTGTTSIGSSTALTGLFNVVGKVWSTVAQFVTQLFIPTSSALVTNSAGEIGIDTTSNQLRYFGTATSTLSPTITPTVTIASTTLTGGSATTTIPLGYAQTAETWSAVICGTDTGTSTLQFGDGTNFTNTITATTSPISTTLSSNNTFTAVEKRVIRVMTTAGTPNYISCTISKTIDAN